MDEFAYEGWDIIERAWREGLTPDPLLTVSEWADRHRVLSSKASSEPGRWRTSRTPYLKAIMDCLSPTCNNRCALRTAPRRAPVRASRAGAVIRAGFATGCRDPSRHPGARCDNLSRRAATTPVHFVS